jgi:hypothetical protein
MPLSLAYTSIQNIGVYSLYLSCHFLQLRAVDKKSWMSRLYLLSHIVALVSDRRVASRLKVNPEKATP